MNAQNPDLTRVLEAIEGLRGTIARLEARVAQVESRHGRPQFGTRPSAAAEAEAQAWRDVGAEVAPAAPPSDEIMMIIGAALAAYLGKKPHIRAIRLVGTDAWAQQGRATLQASYAVSTNPAR